MIAGIDIADVIAVRRRFAGTEDFTDNFPEVRGIVHILW